MFSRNYPDFISPPPGYSGNALSFTGSGKAIPETADHCPCRNHPRRPVFEDLPEKPAGEKYDAPDGICSRGSSGAFYDDMLLAGLLILLFGEENVDNLTLFVLCFLLFSK